MGGSSSASAPSAPTDPRAMTPEALRARLREFKVDAPADATREMLVELLEEATRPKPGLMKQLQSGYEELVGAIIRPPRITYTTASLGRHHFRVEGLPGEFNRTDLEITNGRGQMLVCSWWDARIRAAEPVPVVVYLHGNSSCRAEAIDVIPTVLGSGCSLFAFDFAGCGSSQGDYVSLGFFESQDLKVIVDYLRASGRVSCVGLWGRSMGAVTAIMYAKTDPSIACMILDSPFASLKQLARDLVDNAQIRVPRFAVSMGLRIVRSSILSRAGFDINDLEPIECAPQCFVPALFGAGEDDDFIPPEHAKQLHAAFAGEKNIVVFEGDHNTPRPEFFLHSAAIFIHNRLVAPTAAPVADVASHRASVGARFVMPAPLAAPNHGRAALGIGQGHSGTHVEHAGFDVTEDYGFVPGQGVVGGDDDDDDLAQILQLIAIQEQREKEEALARKGT